jgi:hypothetical protein
MYIAVDSSTSNVMLFASLSATMTDTLYGEQAPESGPPIRLNARIWFPWPHLALNSE